ncbi:MAG TPA: hypothetical protein VGN17_17745 [Bryobacteraceae bacterium]|jgi:hypothetical protein
MTNWLPVIAMSGVGGMLLGMGTLLWVRLRGYRRASAGNSVPPGEFGAARLAPLERLMSGDDLEFLREFSACRPHLAAQWERERRQIFRLYLREAAAEFQRVHGEARQLVARAPEEHADLVGKLMRQQVTFWVTLTKIELHLALGGLGLGEIDARKIVALIEVTQAEVRPGLRTA